MCINHYRRWFAIRIHIHVHVYIAKINENKNSLNIEEWSASMDTTTYFSQYPLDARWGRAAANWAERETFKLFTQTNRRNHPYKPPWNFIYFTRQPTVEGHMRYELIGLPVVHLSLCSTRISRQILQRTLTQAHTSIDFATFSEWPYHRSPWYILYCRRNTEGSVSQRRCSRQRGPAKTNI